MQFSQPLHKTQSKQGFINVAVVIIVLVAVAISGYFVFVKDTKVAVVPTHTPSQSVSSSPIPKDEISGWETYRDLKYGFEFKYPSDWGTSFIEVRRPLNGYLYENPPAGLTFKYDSMFETWAPADKFTHAEDTSSLVAEVTKNGTKWYFTGTADGVGGAFTALIPDTKNNVMIAIWNGWSICPDETQPCPSISVDPSAVAQQELFGMLSTFKFTR